MSLNTTGMAQKNPFDAVFMNAIEIDESDGAVQRGASSPTGANSQAGESFQTGKTTNESFANLCQPYFSAGNITQDLSLALSQPDPLDVARDCLKKDPKTIKDIVTWLLTLVQNAIIGIKPSALRDLKDILDNTRLTGRYEGKDRATGKKSDIDIEFAPDQENIPILKVIYTMVRAELEDYARSNGADKPQITIGSFLTSNSEDNNGDGIFDLRKPDHGKGKAIDINGIGDFNTPAAVARVSEIIEDITNGNNQKFTFGLPLQGGFLSPDDALEKAQALAIGKRSTEEQRLQKKVEQAMVAGDWAAETRAKAELKNLINTPLEAQGYIPFKSGLFSTTWTNGTWSTPAQLKQKQVNLGIQDTALRQQLNELVRAGRVTVIRDNDNHMHIEIDNE